MLLPILSYKNTKHSGMTNPLSASALCLLLFFSTLFSSIAYAEKSYIKCWKNAEGLTECGNRIPRKYYEQRIRYIDDKGVTRKVKERAKTKEELDTEKETAKLLSLEAEQKRKSDQYDDVLLKTYLSIDDLLVSLNSKLNILKSRATILVSSLESKKREFSQLIKQAAERERAGKQISGQLATKLDSTRGELRNLQSQISTDEKNTQQIKKTFAHDVERFMISKSAQIQQSLTKPGQAKKLHAVRITCLSKAQCDQHWTKAKSFIKEFASTKVIYETDKISVTDIPLKHQDIAMGLSLLERPQPKEAKVQEKGNIIIFQIRCNLETEGQNFCSSGEVDGLLREFRTMVYK